MFQAQGGRLCFVQSSPEFEDEVSETKATDEVLAYVNGGHEYALLNPHGEQSSKLSISRQRHFSNLDDETGQDFCGITITSPILSCMVNLHVHIFSFVNHIVITANSIAQMYPSVTNAENLFRLIR